jgi:mannan endo-1,4-beta-mannosidase
MAARLFPASAATTTSAPRSALPLLLLLAAANIPAAAAFGFVTASNGSFYEDGRPARFAGTNELSLAQFSDAFGVNDTLARMARANLTLLRLWAFSDGANCTPAPSQNFFQCWDAATSQVVINETAIALHLDTALAAASSARVHVILSLINNWDAYGGIPTYVLWRDAAGAAGVAPPLPTPAQHDDFFTDATMRGWYRSWVTALAGRVNTVTGVAYRDDPTIFAWELGNELACVNASAAAGCVAPNGTSPATRAWVAEMSAHVKAVDATHMVSIGDEGFYGADDTGSLQCPAKPSAPSGRQWFCDGSAGDWLGLLRLPGVDFASVHLYPDSFNMGEWGLGSEDAVARGWIVNHTSEAHACGKPILFGEFGHGEAGLSQHTKYANYTQAAADAGADGWAVWMLATLEDLYSRTPAWPSWWRGGDAALQVYCLDGGDPPPPADGGSHDLDSCGVIAAAATRLGAPRL